MAPLEVFHLLGWVAHTTYTRESRDLEAEPSLFMLVVVQLLSHVQLFTTPQTAAYQPSLFFTTTQFAQIQVRWMDDAIQPSHPLSLLLLLPSIFLSIKFFSYELALCIRWPKYWSFSISPSNKYSGLISFRIDWFDLLAVQGTLKILLSHDNSKASVLWCSAFFMVQVSHLYVLFNAVMWLGKEFEFNVMLFKK